MKLKPYHEIVGLSKEKIDEAMAPIRAKQIQARAALQKADLEAEIAAKETRIQEICLEKDLPFGILLDELDKLELLNRRREQYGEVIAQLFPTAN